MPLGILPSNWTKLTSYRENNIRIVVARVWDGLEDVPFSRKAVDHLKNSEQFCFQVKYTNQKTCSLRTSGEHGKKCMTFGLGRSHIIQKGDRP